MEHPPHALTEPRSLDLAVVTPQLSHYGGAEIFLLECIKVWQRRARVTLYTARYEVALLEAFGVRRRGLTIELLSPPTGNDLLYDMLVLPGIWENEIGSHHVYFTYLYPAHFIRRRPSVSMVSEPMRMLYDLRFHSVREEEGDTSFHVYPRMAYNREKSSRANSVFSVLEQADRNLQFDRLVTMSNTTSDYLHAVYGRKVDRVVRPGVHLVRPAAFPSEPGAIFVGRLWHHKRVDLLIKALARVSSGRLVIVGEGPELPVLQGIAVELGVMERITFAGNVAPERLMDLYSRATCAVYVPINEPFGMVPLEAAAAGRPSIATRSGGFCEVLDESCAVFVAPDVGDIAAAMEALFTNPAEAARIGARARSKVKALKWSDSADELFGLFHAARDDVAVATPAAAPQVGAHYYAWYEADSGRHWNDNLETGTVTDLPSAGMYSSNSTDTISRHLGLAERAGLDFLVVNWQIEAGGLNPVELDATRKLLAMIEKRGCSLSVSILLAVETDDFSVLEQALQTVRTEFTPHPAYQRHQGRPLLWYLLSNHLPGQIFHHFSRFEELNRRFAPIAAGAVPYHTRLPQAMERMFLGWTLYSPLQAGPASERESIWARSYREFYLSRHNRGIRVFTVCPGYDDTALSDAAREGGVLRDVPRRNGETYQHMTQTARNLEPGPELVVVTSFNEFHENTHIEPSIEHGDHYIRATRHFVESLRSGNEELLTVTG